MLNRIPLYIAIIILVVLITLACNAGSPKKKIDVFRLGHIALPVGFPLSHLWLSGCKNGKPMYFNGSLDTCCPWSVFLNCSVDPAIVFNEIKTQAVSGGFREVSWQPPNITNSINSPNGVHGQCAYANNDGWVFGAAYHDYSNADPKFIERWNIVGDPRTIVIEIMPPEKK